jgi:hypothetical protein
MNLSAQIAQGVPTMLFSLEFLFVLYECCWGYRFRCRPPPEKSNRFPEEILRKNEDLDLSLQRTSSKRTC